MKMPSLGFRNITRKTVVAEIDIPQSDMDPSVNTPDRMEPCELKGERRCQDNRCIPSIDLCPEEQLVNQNTILIMIVVGLAVVIFLIVLYCFQQRQRQNPRRAVSSQSEGIEDDDHASLNLPPPSYEEVVTTNLYPPTPETRRNNRIPSWMEPPPMTPPPNYNAALQILARSHESVLDPKTVTVPRRQSSSNLVRRSVSVDLIQSSRENTPVPISLHEENEVFFSEKPDHIS